MKRRFLSVVTALALCLSLCPTWAFAAESEIVPDDEVLALCTHGERVDDCRICPIEDLIAALPRALTEDNAETVRWQLDEILDLYRELSWEEQEQLDLTLCYELQAALDPANEPVTVDEPAEGAVAMIEKEGEGPTYVTNLADAFTQDNSGATVTLLQTVDLGSESLFIPDDTTFTLEGGAYEITSSHAVATVDLGLRSTFTLLSGALRNTGAMGAAVNVNNANAAFTMSGGTVNGTYSAVSCLNSLSSVNISGGAVNGGAMGLNVPNGTVKLSGGTYSSIYVPGKTVADILADGCALQVGDELIDRSTSLSGRQNDVSVVNPCPHGALQDNGDGTHGGDCPYCGKKLDAEPCSYGTEYQHDENSHWKTCTVCGYENKVAHTFQLAVRANGTVITASDACDCGYQKDLGTVTLTVPASLTYNDEQTIAWKASEGLNLFNGAIRAEWLDESGRTEGGQQQYSTNIPVAWPLPAGYFPLSAGKHSLVITVDVSADSSLTPDRYASCTIPVTINQVELTADMVEPLANVSYNGTPQKPDITIIYKQFMPAEGIDWDVTYSTNDFTSAGTITIIIKGKGDYTGTVETSYTIEKATPVIAWDATTQELTYTGKTDDIYKPTVTLVDGGTFNGEITYSYDGYTGPNLPTNVGTYTITASIAESGNYTAAGTEIPLALTISKSTPTIAFASGYNPSKTYDGQTIADPTASALNITGASYENVKFEWSGTPQDAGSYTLTATIPETDNTAKAEATLTVTISPKTVNAALKKPLSKI